MSGELEINRLSYEERQAAFEQLMRPPQRVLPFIRGSRNPGGPVFRTGQFRGVVALARVKAKRIVIGNHFRSATTSIATPKRDTHE